MGKKQLAVDSLQWAKSSWQFVVGKEQEAKGSWQKKPSFIYHELFAKIFQFLLLWREFIPKVGRLG
jgi:hypothetical protein